tara:strand:- start:2684 stop:3745 length:1062 start_codon:yes stop_codon:yes gene_type:complete
MRTNNLGGVTKAELESIFYNKKFDFSYSSMNKLIGAPTVFYKEYILKQREDVDAKHLRKGKIIHYLLLDNGLFSQQYILAPEGIPGDTTKNIVDEVFQQYKELQTQSEKPLPNQLKDYEDNILEILARLPLHQKLVDDKKSPFLTGDEKRINKIITTQTEEYFAFLMNLGDREIMDPKELEECIVAVEALRANKTIRELLGLDVEFADENFGVYNELYHRVDTKYAWGLKGFIDNVVVDVKNKTVRINDLKTTGKSLTLFKESVEFWNYWLQAGVYLILVMDYLKEVIDSSWTIEFRFVVIDKYNHVYPFKVSKETLTTWVNKSNEQFEKSDYHYENRNFTLPYEFIAGEVIL